MAAAPQNSSPEARWLGTRFFLVIAGIWMLNMLVMMVSFIHLRFSSPGNHGLRNYLHWKYHSFPRYFFESDAWKLFLVCVVSGVVFLVMEAWTGTKLGRRIQSGTPRRWPELVVQSLVTAIICSSVMAMSLLSFGISIDDQYYRLRMDEFLLFASMMLIPWIFASVSGNLLGYEFLIRRLNLNQKIGSPGPPNMHHRSQ